MVASGKASVFILRAKEKTTIKVNRFLFPFFCVSPDALFFSSWFDLFDAFQAWDHAVGMICVHEAGGKVCFYLFCLSVYPVNVK